MFRRRSNEAPDLLEPVEPDEPDVESGTPRGFTPSKGRPTPKRSEAEKRRREPYSAPGDRKAAASQARNRDRGERQRKMVAARRGESWALPRKDQGPVRALARDVVDSRRGLSEYYLYSIVVLVALLFVPALRGTVVVDVVLVIVIAVIVIEGRIVGRRVQRLAAERFPGESTRGIVLYAAMRGTQPRRMRVPAPRVNRGAKI